MVEHTFDSCPYGDPKRHSLVYIDGSPVGSCLLLFNCYNVMARCTRSTGIFTRTTVEWTSPLQVQQLGDAGCLHRLVMEAKVSG